MPERPKALQGKIDFRPRATSTAMALQERPQATANCLAHSLVNPVHAASALVDDFLPILWRSQLLQQRSLFVEEAPKCPNKESILILNYH